MKIALISDLHSNEEALVAVLEDIAKKKADKVVCLGDIIGYGASPGECVELVRKNADIVIAGNHDMAALGLTNKDYFNPNAKHAVEWTQNQLSKEDSQFLRDLPMVEELDDLIFVHANLNDPSGWGYILDEFDADTTFSSMNNHRLCFIGHSHVPVVFEEGEIVKYLGNYEHFPTLPDRKYIVNVGSVGQPRDGNPDAAYVLYDTHHASIELRRVPYDIKNAQFRILRAGLPEFLAERIAFGR